MVSSLSIVILAYNEAENIAKSLTEVSAIAKHLGLDYEILVVNDGSTDKTGDIAKSYLKKIPHLRIVENRPNRGYGGSLKRGLADSTKDFVVITHADNQFDFSEVKQLLAAQANSDADVVCGIRQGGGVDPFHRRLNRWGWNTIVRALFGYLATDIDSGFKLYRRSILANLYTPAERGAMIDTQLLANLRARGFRIIEIPVTHLPRTAGKSTGANLHVILRSFIDLFTFWWQLKRGILVEKGLAVFRYEALLLLLFLIIGGISRLYRIDSYMTFLGDEGRDARVMRAIMTGKHFPLLGPGTSIGNMYLGPWYYYLTAPALAIANFNPVGPAIEVALIGLLTIALLWWVARQFFGRPIGIALAALYALSPVVIIYSRSSWNPNIMPFFALLAMYGIWKVAKYGYWRWLVISAFAFAIALNSHYLGLLLLPPLGVYFLVAWRRHPSPNRLRSVAVAVGLFLLLMSPLFFFDLRHNWLNFNSLKHFFSDRQTTVNLKAYKALPNVYPVWHTMTSSLLGANTSAAASALSLVLPLLALLTLKLKKPRFETVFVWVWLLSGVIGLGLYKQHIYDHYFGFLFPAVFLFLGAALWPIVYTWRLRPLFYLLVAGLVILQLTRHPLRFAPNSQLAHTQAVVADVLTKTSDQPFNFALLADHNYDESYRYFLELAGAPLYTIHQQLTNQLFVICEKPVCQPINDPLWEVAAFGWAKIDSQWTYPWGVTGYRLIHTTPL